MTEVLAHDQAEPAYSEAYRFIIGHNETKEHQAIDIANIVVLFNSAVAVWG